MKRGVKSKKISKCLSISTNKITLNLCLIDLKDKITERQFVILKLKLESFKNIDIARKVKVCPATITNEIYRIKPILQEYVR